MIWHKDLIRFLPDDILNELCKDCVKTLTSVTEDISWTHVEELDDLSTYILLVLCEAYSRNMDVVDPCLTKLYKLLPDIYALVPYHDIYSDLMTESRLRGDLYSLEDYYYQGKISENDWIPFINAFPQFNLSLKEA